MNHDGGLLIAASGKEDGLLTLLHILYLVVS